MFNYAFRTFVLTGLADALMFFIAVCVTGSYYSWRYTGGAAWHIHFLKELQVIKNLAADINSVAEITGEMFAQVRNVAA